MLKLRVRRSAQRDIDDIWEFTRERWSPGQANRYVKQLHHAVESLRRKPEKARPLKTHAAGFLKYPSGSHVIFFLVHDDTLEVVRVLHQRMDFSAHLPEIP